jgi:hypothetical protein
VQSVSARSVGLPAGAAPRHTTLDSERLRNRYALAAPDPWAVIDSVIDARNSTTSSDCELITHSLSTARYLED